MPLRHKRSQQIAQRRQGHPQITRGQPAQFAAQPPGRSPVVRHRHHGHQLVGDLPQGLQGRGQSVPAAQSGHLGRTHSRPKSRWRTETCTPSARSRAAKASLMAVLRCLPPVHPIAMVAWRLPSRK